MRELKQCVEEWMSNKFQVTLNYDPTEAIKQLEDFGLLVAKQKGMKQAIFAYFLRERSHFISFYFILFHFM